MYTTCLFCATDLGRNEVLEHFPLGRRLAFDAARGRLWVVCTRCERWNLTPLDTRWEAIEDAERAFRGAGLRASTDNIGLAQLREGLELVRVGAPLRAEFAAWRYGDQFGRRRRKHIAVATAGLSASLLPVVVPFAGMLGIGALWGGMGATVLAGMSLTGTGYTIVNAVRGRREGKAVSVLIRSAENHLLHLTPPNLRAAALQLSLDPDGWCLDVPHRFDRSTGLDGERTPDSVTVTRHTRLTGEPAKRALTRILPYLNRDGGGMRRVREAVAVVESQSTVARLLSLAASTTTLDDGLSLALYTRPNSIDDAGVGKVAQLPASVRLALEIALHDEDEDRAMHGELLELEERWREAEVIAGIADSLLLPVEIENRLSELRKRGAG